MSYILDALRRADAERTRGAVPGLHAHNAPADGEPAARNLAPLIWGAGAAGALLVAVVAAVVFGPWRMQPDAKMAAAPPELAPHDGAPVDLPPARPDATDPGARPIAAAPGRDRAFAPEAGRVPPPQRVAEVARVVAPAQPTVEHYGAPITPAKPAAIPRIDELPADMRSQLPRLAVGGAIYSDTPSARMVILNGQVFHEGDKPAADTVLEQIRLKSAIFAFRGQRYEVAF